MIDAYGAGPFMVATKIKGMVAAEVSDERSHQIRVDMLNKMG
ncbi:galactose-6-phosphate isomerase subunit LacA [Streptococcus pneumoniae]|nr:galactose-6-phosphate isomerase subunit LacA [Streptococcus pneumoniae]